MRNGNRLLEPVIEAGFITAVGEQKFKAKLELSGWRRILATRHRQKTLPKD